MLRARIHFADLDSPAGVADGRIFFGSSVIEPFQHRLLRSVCVESPGLIAIICMERLADEPEDDSFTEVAEDADLLAHIGEAQRHLLDWTTLLIDRKRLEIRYTASLIHSAPVYLRAQGNALELDWDYSRLLGSSPVEIEWNAALAHVAGFTHYTPHTMVSGMYRSIAGATLVTTPQGVAAEIPAPFVRTGPQRLSNEVSVESLFYGTVKALVAARPLMRGRTAVEISGGMDSGLIALATADVLGQGVLSCGAQFDGAMGAAQRARRRLICEAGGYDDLEVPANRFAPFREGSRRRDRYGVWPQDENYPELFESIFAMLANAGIDTLFSGFGGDELYAAYVGEEPEEIGLRDMPHHPFLTDEGWCRAKLAGCEEETRTLQTTSWLSAAGRSQRLLRYGIWPIYPYNSPELATFVGKLPWHYRRNRTLLRNALTNRLENSVFQTDYVKESFLGVAIRGLQENKQYLKALLARSPVMRRDLVDVDHVTRALDAEVNELPQSKFGLLYLMLTAACFFQD